MLDDRRRSQLRRDPGSGEPHPGARPTLDGHLDPVVVPVGDVLELVEGGQGGVVPSGIEIGEVPGDAPARCTGAGGHEVRQAVGGGAGRARRGSPAGTVPPATAPGTVVVPGPGPQGPVDEHGEHAPEFRVPHGRRRQRRRSLSSMLFGKHKSTMVDPASALPGRDRQIPGVPETHFVNFHRIQPPFPDGLALAQFGLGCFWGAERKFWELDGVWSTAVGYAGGYTPNPTYEEVCSGRTGHTEAVLVVYDPAKVSYEELLRTFWESHDPTQGMRQGNDVGTQYRSAIYTYTPEQRKAAEATQRRLPGAAPRRGAWRHHHRDRRRARPSTGPRTTTSSTWPRTRWATAARRRPA